MVNFPSSEGLLGPGHTSQDVPESFFHISPPAAGNVPRSWSRHKKMSLHLKFEIICDVCVHRNPLNSLEAHFRPNSVPHSTHFLRGFRFLVPKTPKPRYLRYLCLTSLPQTTSSSGAEQQQQQHQQSGGRRGPAPKKCRTSNVQCNGSIALQICLEGNR